jgi:hypothetical protein
MAMNIPHERHDDDMLTLSSNIYKFIRSYEVHRRAMLTLQRPGFDYCGCTEIAARAGPATKICLCNSKVTLGQRDAKPLSPKRQGQLVRLFWNLDTGVKERPGRIPRDYIPHVALLYPFPMAFFNQIKLCIAAVGDRVCKQPHHAFCAHQLTEVQARLMLHWLRNYEYTGELAHYLDITKYLSLYIRDIQDAQRWKENQDREAAFERCASCQHWFREAVLDRRTCVCEVRLLPFTCAILIIRLLTQPVA